MTLPVPEASYSPFAFQISSASHPKTMDDLNTFHKDSMYELVSATRAAYLMKILASKLASHVTKSSNVRDLANLITDSAREQERSLRMAACMSNAPVSTTYPYLPVMPTKLSLQPSQNLPPSSAPVSSPSTPSGSGSVPLSQPLEEGIGNPALLLVNQCAYVTKETSPSFKWAEFI